MKESVLLIWQRFCSGLLSQPRFNPSADGKSPVDPIFEPTQPSVAMKQSHAVAAISSNIEQKIVAVRVRSLSQVEWALVVEIAVSVATLLDKLCCG